MKIYDKEMYARNESVKSALVIILTFMLGFIVGCLVINFDMKNKIAEKDSYITDLDKTIQKQENLISDHNTGSDTENANAAVEASAFTEATDNNNDVSTSAEATSNAQ